MIIKVIQRHIKNGVRLNPFSCPIALALREKLNSYHIKVDKDECVIDTLVYKLPRFAQHFIKKFDDGKKVKPFNFKLDY